jgi:hypothetical protein
VNSKMDLEEKDNLNQESQNGVCECSFCGRNFQLSMLDKHEIEC